MAITWHSLQTKKLVQSLTNIQGQQRKEIAILMKTEFQKLNFLISNTISKNINDYTLKITQTSKYEYFRAHLKNLIRQNKISKQASGDKMIS